MEDEESSSTPSMGTPLSSRKSRSLPIFLRLPTTVWLSSGCGAAADETADAGGLVDVDEADENVNRDEEAEEVEEEDEEEDEADVVVSTEIGAASGFPTSGVNVSTLMATLLVINGPWFGAGRAFEVQVVEFRAFERVARVGWLFACCVWIN